MTEINVQIAFEEIVDGVNFADAVYVPMENWDKLSKSQKDALVKEKKAERINSWKATKKAASESEA